VWAWGITKPGIYRCICSYLQKINENKRVLRITTEAWIMGSISKGVIKEKALEAIKETENGLGTI
jgi:hypothetical protein